MAVGGMETVTVVKKCASAELLGRATKWEDALLHWINVVRTDSHTCHTHVRNISHECILKI